MHETQILGAGMVPTKLVALDVVLADGVTMRMSARSAEALIDALVDVHQYWEKRSRQPERATDE